MCNKNSKVYLIGGWIASLSAAVYLINDTLINPKNIYIFDGAKKFWWSLDAKKSKTKNWYIMRWIRMFEYKAFSSTIELMSKIPSLNKPWKTLKEEFVNFNNKHKTYCETRLLKKWKAINWKSLWLSIKNRIKIIKLLLTKESKLDNLKIEDYFYNEFFKSNFRYEVCTIFAFQTWHSLIEFRRYLLRFIHTFDFLDTLEPVVITPHNQYESLILPIQKWLEKKWVNFENNTNITNLKFQQNWDKQIVKQINLKRWNEKEQIILNENDYVFTTIWSMVANSSNWTMNKAPKLKIDDKHPSWKLWEKISKKNSDFWNPKVFNSDIEKTKWTVFTITFKNQFFFKLMKKFVNKKVTSHWWITLLDSNWFISLVLFHKTYFKNQDKNIKLSWWYTLFPEKKWNFVKKKLIDCSWEEILIEIIYHLKLEKHLDKILKDTICIPTITPYVTSHFLPRKTWDRPQIIPKSTKNLAFLWQFCEIPNDIVFTVEYSIRSSEIAVKELFNKNKKITTIYKWYFNLKILLWALKIIFRK